LEKEHQLIAAEKAKLVVQKRLGTNQNQNQSESQNQDNSRQDNWHNQVKSRCLCVNIFQCVTEKLNQLVSILKQKSVFTNLTGYSLS
jgi:hypothetical protein